MNNFHNSFLFDSHLHNLHSVSPNAGEIFVCPICFSIFSRNEAFDSNNVNLGHVWPQFIRNLVSEQSARHQHVLLCQSCNSQAGYRGDHEMQEFEIALRGDRAGKPERKRRILVRPSNGDPQFQMYAFYKPTGNKTLNLTFRASPKAFKYNKQYLRYQEYAQKQIPCDIIVMPHDANWQLAQVGWLTSAYLYAFYTFGYQYVLQSTLDPVRDYIKRSFSGITDNQLLLDKHKDILVQPCELHNFQEPNMEFIMHTQGSNVPCHLEISLVHYHIRLPIPLKSPIEISVDDLPDSQMVLAADATGHIPHDETCYWEELLAEPDYEIIGNEIFRRSI